MSFKGCDYTINVVSDTDTTAIQTQVNENTAAIAELDTRLDADELQIELNKNNVASIGYIKNIPISAFPPAVVLDEVGDWFSIGEFTVEHSGLYMIQSCYMASWSTVNATDMFAVGNGMELFVNGVENTCVMGGSCIASTYRPDEWASSGIQNTMFANLTKNTTLSISLFLCFGKPSKTVEFRTGFTETGVNQYGRAPINMPPYSGVNLILLSAS